MEKWYVRIPDNKEIKRAVQKEIFRKGYFLSGGSQSMYDYAFRTIGIGSDYEPGEICVNLTRYSIEEATELSIYEIFTDKLPYYKEPEPEKTIPIDGFGEVSEATIREALKAKFS